MAGYLILIVISALFIFCLVYGSNSTKHFKVNRIKIEVDGLPLGFDGARVLHLSDLHNSFFGKDNMELTEKVDDMRPDYIFVTGDCIDRFTKNGDAFISFVKNIEGRYPVYYSLGNHDVTVLRTDGDVFSEFRETIVSLGVTVIDDENVTLERDGGCIRLYGFTPVRDENLHGVKVSAETLREKLGECPKNETVFLLAHEGGFFDAFADWGADITFSGHIHGGIVRLPFLGGVFGDGGRLFPKYCAGVYEKDGKIMNLSAGLGYTKFKFRFMNPPEMTLIKLKSR